MQVILSLLIVASLILFIVGLLSPKTSLFWYKKERTRKRSSLIYGLTLIVAFIIFGSMQGRNPNGTIKKINAKEADEVVQSYVTPVPPPKEETVQPTYKKVGDVIEVGNFVYRVNSIKFVKSIGDEYTRQTADGLYLIVNMTIKNLDNEPHTLDGSFFKLTDANGTEFETSNEGETALEMQSSNMETLFLKKFNPNIEKKGVLVFEVPDKNIFDLHLSGGYWNGATAIVKLTE